jgi:signal transduction histidine kinase
MTISLLDAIERLQPPGHLCAIYGSQDEQFASAIPFIQIGLKRGERCVYITDDGDRLEPVRAALKDAGADVDYAIRSGALVVQTKDWAYLGGNRFDLGQILNFWAKQSEEALRSGYSGLRVTAETDWVTRGAAGIERWLEYESLVTNRLAEVGCVALCQYDQRVCPPELILNLIRTHPLVVYRGMVCQNFYFVPPEEFLAPDSVEREVQRLLHNMQENERILLELKAVHDQLAGELNERTQAENEILSLTERLINAQEEERTRIARELHDDFGQQIAALSIAFNNLRRHIPEEKREPREQADLLYQGFLRLASGVRNLSHQLHPAVLEHAGLPAALESYCAEFSSLSGLSVSFEAVGTVEDLSPRVALCLYRVTQEALQNVAKHAAAKDVEVRLKRSNGVVRLTVTDHGAGFQPSSARASGGLGLASIKERVRLVNGVFVLESEPGRGTTLTVDIPIAGRFPGASR